MSSFFSRVRAGLAKTAAPNNLKFFEGILKSTPKNEDLIVMTAKNYALFAFAFLDAQITHAADDREQKNTHRSNGSQQSDSVLATRALPFPPLNPAVGQGLEEFTLEHGASLGETEGRFLLIS